MFSCRLHNRVKRGFFLWPQNCLCFRSISCVARRHFRVVGVTLLYRHYIDYVSISWHALSCPNGASSSSPFVLNQPNFPYVISFRACSHYSSVTSRFPVLFWRPSLYHISHFTHAAVKWYDNQFTQVKTLPPLTAHCPNNCTHYPTHTHTPDTMYSLQWTSTEVKRT
jgi:hypothetical protein